MANSNDCAKGALGWCPMDVEADDVCWICLDEALDNQRLMRPCRCPRSAHPRCLARWQLQQAGRAEETHCRFCQSPLSDWKASLTPEALKPDVERVQPIMVVYFEGEIHRIPVRQGDEGLHEFTTRIRQLFSLPEDVDISLTFGCKEPMSGQHLKLEGMGAFDAAVHCASVAAAERQLKMRAGGLRGAGSARSSHSGSSSGGRSGEDSNPTLPYSTPDPDNLETEGDTLPPPPQTGATPVLQGAALPADSVALPPAAGADASSPTCQSAGPLFNSGQSHPGWSQPLAPPTPQQLAVVSEQVLAKHGLTYPRHSLSDLAPAPNAPSSSPPSFTHQPGGTLRFIHPSSGGGAFTSLPGFTRRLPHALPTSPLLWPLTPQAATPACPDMRAASPFAPAPLNTPTHHLLPRSPAPRTSLDHQDLQDHQDHLTPAWRLAPPPASPAPSGFQCIPGPGTPPWTSATCFPPATSLSLPSSLPCPAPPHPSHRAPPGPASGLQDQDPSMASPTSSSSGPGLSAMHLLQALREQQAQHSHFMATALPPAPSCPWAACLKDASNSAEGGAGVRPVLSTSALATRPAAPIPAPSALPSAILDPPQATLTPCTATPLLLPAAHCLKAQPRLATMPSQQDGCCITDFFHPASPCSSPSADMGQSGQGAGGTLQTPFVASARRLCRSHTTTQDPDSSSSPPSPSPDTCSALHPSSPTPGLHPSMGTGIHPLQLSEQDPPLPSPTPNTLRYPLCSSSRGSNSSSSSSEQQSSSRTRSTSPRAKTLKQAAGKLRSSLKAFGCKVVRSLQFTPSTYNPTAIAPAPAPRTTAALETSTLETSTVVDSSHGTHQSEGLVLAAPPAPATTCQPPAAAAPQAGGHPFSSYPAWYPATAPTPSGRRTEGPSSQWADPGSCGQVQGSGSEAPLHPVLAATDSAALHELPGYLSRQLGTAHRL